MGPGKIRSVFLFLLGLTYIGMGIFIFVKKVIPTSPWGELLSLLFILYGAWRAYRAIAVLRTQSAESAEMESD